MQSIGVNKCYGCGRLLKDDELNWKESEEYSAYMEGVVYCPWCGHVFSEQPLK